MVSFVTFPQDLDRAVVIFRPGGGAGAETRDRERGGIPSFSWELTNKRYGDLMGLDCFFFFFFYKNLKKQVSWC